MGKSKEVEIWWKFRENSLISVVFFLRTSRVQYSSGECFSAKAEVAATPDEAKAREFGVRTASFSAQVNSELLSTFAQLIDEGLIKVVVGAVFSPSEAGNAQNLSQTGHGRGRIILHIA
jgi:NADPH:quinone reductase-like Zn-dependent oxidoreductase